MQTSLTRHMEPISNILQAGDWSYLCWRLGNDKSLPPWLSHSELVQYICQGNPTRGEWANVQKTSGSKGFPFIPAITLTLMFWTARPGVVTQAEQVEADAEMVELPNAVLPVCPWHAQACHKSVIINVIVLVGYWLLKPLVGQHFLDTCWIKVDCPDRRSAYHASCIVCREISG